MRIETASSRLDAALLREQHALAESEHLLRKADVDRELHQQPAAVAADPRHLRPEPGEDRRNAGERMVGATHHDRERARLGGRHASRHGRVEHRRAARGDELRDPPARLRADRAHIGVHRFGSEAGNDAVGARRDRKQRVVVRDHAEHHPRLLSDLARGVVPDEAAPDERLGLRLRSIRSVNGLPGVEQPAGEPAPHRAESDEADRRRRRGLPSRSATSRLRCLVAAGHPECPFCDLVKTKLAVSI